MRKFGLFLCLSLLFAFTGCSDSDDVEEQGGTVLAKPSVAVTTTTSSSFKVAWDAVPNAESYKYRLSQENETGDELVVQPENSTSATALAFGDLDPKTKYILRVKAVAAAGSGLTDSEYSKIFATTLAEEAAELTFEKIAATNPTYESVDVEIVPSAENLYYWQVVENSLIEGKSDREIVAALKENISELSSGTVKKTVYGLKADTEYTVVAFGYDLDAGKSTSAVARLETAFTTPADDRMTIAITVGTVTAENAHVAFAPSMANADYFADVVAAADIAGKTEMEIVALLQTKYGDEMDEIARKGDYEGDFAVEAGKEYTAVAFAYDAATSELTTKLASETFSAPLPDGDDILSITLSNPTEFSFDYSITSSDPDMYYTEMAVPTANLSQFDETKEAAALISDINALCAEYGLEAVLSICHKGNITDTFDGLSPNTEYTLFAIGISPVSGTETVEAVTTFAKSKNSITTGKEEEITTDAWTNVTSALWEVQDSGPAIFFFCEPNASSKSVKIGCWNITIPDGVAPPTSLEDIQGLDSEANVRQLTISQGGKLDMTRLYYGTDATAGGVYVFSAVSQDADGKYGQVNWVIAQMPASFSGSYGDCTVLGQSANNNSSGGGDEEIELKSATYEDYLGAWTLVSAGGSAVLSDGKVKFTNNPLYYDIRIEKNVENQSYKVYGWNTDTEFANAHPFVMNYDPTEESGISGWIDIPLAQVVATEGNIDWTLCPRFLANNNYYYYPNTNMTQAFFGASEAGGSVIIMGNSYKFEDPIGVVDILSMSLFGIDKTDSEADPELRPLETTHAISPFVLVKGDVSSSAAKRLQTERKIAGISRVSSTVDNFARLSTAASISQSQPARVQRILESADNLHIEHQINGESTGSFRVGPVSEVKARIRQLIK